VSRSHPAARLLLTCEHGGNRVPEDYRPIFQDAEDVLATHRGWDPGALPVARTMASRLDAPLVAGTTTRLLVELNRTLEHPALFSEFTRELPEEDRERIVDRHYLPHRRRVESAIRERIDGDRPVLHVGVHSFTPVLDGRERAVDVGLLYDPSREREERVCRSWAAALRERAPTLRVAGNAPYRGTDDGLSSFLRQSFPRSAYVGVEIELNQALVGAEGETRDAVARVVSETLEEALEEEADARKATAERSPEPVSGRDRPEDP